MQCTVIESLDSDLPSECKDRWDSLKDFIQVGNQSIEDVMSCSTNTMLNLLVEKRAVCLYNAKVSSDEKKALRFLHPLDSKGRVFSGRLYDFAKVRKEMTSSRL